MTVTLIEPIKEKEMVKKLNSKRILPIIAAVVIISCDGF